MEGGGQADDHAHSGRSNLRTAEPHGRPRRRAAERDQSAQALGANPMPENPLDRADGDLLQARALAEGHPGSPTALARLASSELGFGNRVSASEAAQKVLENETIDAPALIVTSQVFVALGEINLTERALHKVLAAPAAGEGVKRAAAVLAARIAAHQGDLERALELLADSGGGTGSALKGAVLAQMGRYHDAIHELRAALKSVPDSPATLCSLGYAYAAAGSTRKAIRATTTAAALAPADQTAGLNLAAMLLSQGEAREAVSAIDRLANHHPGDIHLDLAAAAILYISGDTATALRRLRRAEASKAARGAAPSQAEELRLNISLLKTRRCPERMYSPSHWKRSNDATTAARPSPACWRAPPSQQQTYHRWKRPTPS